MCRWCMAIVDDTADDVPAGARAGALNVRTMSAPPFRPAMSATLVRARLGAGA